MKKIKKVLYIFFIITIFHNKLAYSNPHSLLETPLEELMEIEVVIAASKYEQKITEAPAAVTVVTSDEIKKFGYRTLVDLLKAVRGFYVTYDRNYHSMGIRGFNRPGDYNTRILLLVDGHKINNNIYEQAFIGNDFILDIDIIDKVEIIRGPGSSLYGSNAFFGIINVITKNPKDIRGVEVSGEAASFDTYKGRLSYGIETKNSFGLISSISAYYSKGQDLFFKEFDIPDQNKGVAEELDNERSKSAFLKSIYKNISLQGAFVGRKKEIPTASFDTLFNVPGTFTYDSQWYLEIKYIYDFTSSSIMSRLYYDQYYYKGNYILENMVKNRDFAKGKWWGGEIQYLVNFYRHKLVFGGEYQNNFHQELLNFDDKPYKLYIKDKKSSYLLGLYIMDEFFILENLLLNAGVRYDYYSTFGDTINPRVSLIYKPFDRTILKAIYGKAFRAPNINELFFTDGITIKPNPGLKPEKIETYEFLIERYLKKHIRVYLSLYYNRIRDLISQQIDPSDRLIVFKNLEEVQAKGVELEIEKKWEDGTTVRASHSFQEAKDKQTGKIITNSPKNLSKVNVIYPLFSKNFFAGLEFQYTGKRKSLKDKTIDDYFITNITLYWSELIKGLNISASIYNLFNEKYHDPGAGEHKQDSLEQDGRTFRIKVTYKF